MIKTNSLQRQFDIKTWIRSLRLPTLIAGASPVMIGTAIASTKGLVSYRIFLFTLLFSVSLQISTNWLNDYFDFIKGADTHARKGPFSELLTGEISPPAMRNAGFAALVFAACISIPLIMRIGLIFTPLMLLCLLCAVFYTGGKFALGYLGLGDLLVLIFYGPVAVCGTVLVQIHSIPPDAWIASLIPGCAS
jgi:1,4-dihydroxy-2-naphthoate octaprenyltransferase